MCDANNIHTVINNNQAFDTHHTIVNILVNGGSDATVLTIYDGTSTSPSRKLIVNAVANATIYLDSVNWTLDKCYTTLTGTGASAFLFYI